MSTPFPPVTDAVYDRGFAVGYSSIKNDTMFFRYKDEVFEIPLLKAHPFAQWNGYWYEVHIDDLRKLKAEAAAG